MPDPHQPVEELHASFQMLSQRWEEAKALWNDLVRRHFERTYWEPLGYSAVCIVDFADLAEALSPDSSPRIQVLEVAQFQTQGRAEQFKQDVETLLQSPELGDVTGPVLAGAIADDLGMNGKWQTLDREALTQLDEGKWRTTHEASEWQSLETTAEQDMQSFAADIEL